MSNVLRLVIVDPNDTSRDSLKNMLLGMEIVWLEAECSRYEFFADVVAQTKPDIGVICVDSDPSKALTLIRQLRETAPDCQLLVASSSTDGQLILQTMRAGAKEFLSMPVKVDDLAAALERINTNRAGKGDGKTKSSKMIAVCGATGGVGCTSLAVNLGCILAKDPNNAVALIDLDLALGDADVFLDAIPDYTLVDVTQNIARLDFNLLRRSLTKHSSGLYLLPRPVQLQDALHITPDDLTRVFGLLRATFTHLIIDTSKAFTAIDVAAMQASHEVLLVTQLDLPCLRNVVRLMISFDEIEGLKDKVKIVVNRAGLDSGQISVKKAQETIGRDIFWQIPNDYRVMIEMRNNGVPLIDQSPKANVTQSLIGLAKSLGAADMLEVETAPAGASGWMKFWPIKKPAAKK